MITKKYNQKNKSKKYNQKNKTKKYNNDSNNRHVKIIDNKTHFYDKILALLIKNNLNKVKPTLNNEEFFNSIKKSNPKSFTPEINKYLVSVKKTDGNKFLICNNNLLKINIGSKKNSKCLNYDNPKVISFLLENLKSKSINCSTIIPPKQYISNCWFNTLFVTFFISDKGRKFFKFFRQLMIEGRLANGTLIPTQLAQSFFMFNIAIEASYNNLLKNIAYQFNTNLLITKIYQAISSITTNVNSNIFRTNEGGNPLEYYKEIMKYLNNNVINLREIIIYNDASSKYISNLISYYNLPDIIIVEIYDSHDQGAGISKNINNKEISLNIHNTTYSLDSCIIRDTQGEHFCSLLTCNSKEYAYDGASYTRFGPFNWKSLINKNKLWGFKGHDLVWNFKNGYQLLFYYRI